MKGGTPVGNFKKSEKQEGISKADMKVLADHIEDYLDVLESVFIIPDSLKRSEERINEALKVARKLVKKLRDGDQLVFKDWDEWNLC